MMNTIINTTESDEFSIVSTANEAIIGSFPTTLQDIEQPIGGWNIQWVTKCNITSNFKPSTITHDKLDKFDFKNNMYFIEFIKCPTYVRLYFDFDEIKDIDEYSEVGHWLDTLVPVFGPYTIGGYANDEELANFTELLYVKEGNHRLSMHVIFPTTCLLASDLMKITKYTEKKGFTNYELHRLVDPNVYKLASRQLLRHVLSDKYVDETHISKTAGVILYDELPSSQVVHVRGNETIVRQSDWEKCFEKVILPTAQKKLDSDIRKATKAMTIDDITVKEDLIIFSHEELVEFLTKHYDPNYQNVFHTICPLFDSPYDLELLTEVVLEWYGTRTHNTEDTNITEFISSKYHHDTTNKWFFSLIKNLDADIRKEYILKYKPAIDWDININNSTSSYTDFKANLCAHPNDRYAPSKIHKLINELRGSIGIIDRSWYIKVRKDGQFIIQILHDDHVKGYFSSIKPIKNNDKLTLGAILNKYSMYFLYLDYKMSKDPILNTINIFQGFKYPEVEAPDYKILDAFLSHIREVICDNDNEKYNYIMQWWANMFVNITVKNSTMPIIHGAQGSGKSFPFEVFCELLGHYALSNVDDLDKVFGKFNGLIGDNICVLINEASDATERFNFAGKIKSKTTQKKIVQERKGIDQIEVESYSNYIVTTNNANPIPSEKGDRRNIFFATNNKYVGNKEYFDNLIKPIQPKKQGDYDMTFMGTLLHYMRHQIDVIDFNAETLIRKINSDVTAEYNPHLSRQYRSLNLVEKYVVDNSDDFEKGVTLDDIPSIGTYTPHAIASILNGLCKVVRRTVTYPNDIKRKVRVYTLKDKEQISDLYNIIEYMKNQREDSE